MQFGPMSARMRSRLSFAMRSSKRDAAATGGTEPEAGRGAMTGAGPETEAVAATAHRTLDAAVIGATTGVSAASGLLAEAPGVAACGAVRLR